MLDTFITSEYMHSDVVPWIYCFIYYYISAYLIAFVLLLYCEPLKFGLELDGAKVKINKQLRELKIVGIF